MDSTPEANSKEFYRAQIRKKLDQQDAFLHRQAILTIEDMRRKGTYRGMTRDMTLEEKQVCLEIEMANLGLEPNEEPELFRDSGPKRTGSLEGSSSLPLSNRQRNTSKPTDSSRPSTSPTIELKRPTSSSVYSSTIKSPPQTTTADIPSCPFSPSDIRWGSREDEDKDAKFPGKIDPVMAMEDLLKQVRNRSCQGDTHNNKDKSNMFQRAKSAKSAELNDSKRTNDAKLKNEKRITGKAALRPHFPARLMSLSEEEFERRCRLEGYLPRRWGYKEF